ncbi:MAG: hypothetical protein FWD61_15655 [Phycisphaerales bacterium]|nr:hypothetical protein [Phycisphaerales bacterium]
MQFRRRWNAWALAAVLLASVAAFAAPVSPDEAATKFKTVKGDDAVKLREDILANAPPKTAIADRERYVGEIGRAFIDQKLFFGENVEGGNVEGPLNAAITISQLQAVGADKCLNAMLSSPNAAIRYWGAKGLIDIASSIKKVGGGKAMTAALHSALSKEPSHLVKKQILGAIVALDDVESMIGALQSIATQMQSTFPDQDNLQVIITALSGSGADAKYSLASLAKQALSPSQKAQVAQAVANIASFAVQQEQAKAVDDRPPNYHGCVTRLFNASADFVNTLTGKTVAILIKKDDLDKGDLDATAMLVDMAFGSPGRDKSGKLQEMVPGVKAPPAITPPAIPTTNPQ